MRLPGHLFFASVLLLSAQATALADCGGTEPLFSASFESTQAFTLSGSVVGLYQGTVEVRAGSMLLGSAPLGYAGNYVLNLPPIAAEAMLNIRVRGVGDQDFLELAAHVGSAGQLDALARASEGLVGDYEHAALVITLQSSVEYSLVTAQAGVGAGPDCALAEIQAALAPQDVTERLAWLKIAMQTGGFGAVNHAPDKRGTTGTTLDLLLDPVAYEEEIERLETEFPGLLGQYEGLVQEPFCDYFQGEQRIVLRDRDLDLSGIYATHLEFETPNAGQFNSVSFSGTFSFTCSNDMARLDFSGATPAEYWSWVNVNGTPTYTRVWRYEDFAEYRPLDVGMQQVALVQTTQGRMHYPDLPDQPDLIFGGTSHRSALIRQPMASAFDPANAPGEYSLPLHAYGHPQTFFRTQLNADGTGSVLDLDETLAWTTEADGSLAVVLADRVVSLLPFRNDGPVRDVFVTVEFPDGSRQVDAQLAYQRDPGAAVAAVDLPAVLRQYGERHNPDLPPFEFDLKADTTAISSQGRVYGWLLDEGRLVLRGCASPSMPLYAEPAPGACTNYERRVFDVFQRDGAFWYVYEERDTWQDSGSGPQLTITQRLNRPYGRLPASP